PADSTAQASITQYAAERVVVEVQTEAPGYLLLTDAFYPGWQATVNDEPALIYRADVMFRAVAVPAGESTVVFTYAPFWRGWLLPLGAGLWAAWALVTAVLWRPRRISLDFH